MTPQTRWSDLCAALAALSPPPPGHVRLYRGQVQDHATLVPTGLRSPRSADDVWLVFASLMAKQVLASERAGGRSGLDLVTSVVWAHAIKQHYGPGTEFLDVTHSPAVASWFALHRASVLPGLAVYGGAGPFDPADDAVGRHEFLRFEAQTDAPGWLYVLDVPAPDGPLGTGHGHLVDLAEAPPPLCDSPRIRAQHACLLRADARQHGGDLRRFVVPGTPLPVAWPLAGCDEVTWPSERLFPGVADDTWYRRFVSLPLVPAAASAVELPQAPGRQLTTWHQPVPVSLVVPDADRRQFEALQGTITTMPRPLLMRANALDHVRRDPALANDPHWARLADATPILLEGPLQSATAAVDSGHWHFGLLFDGIEAVAPVTDLQGVSRGQASLHNVLIEFSPLEDADWLDWDRPDAPPRDLARALWLRREPDGRWLATLWRQELPQHGTYVIGPFESRAAPAGGGLELRGQRAGGRWIAAAELDIVARPLIKSLALLRDLSPPPKLAATPSLVAGRVRMLPIHPAIGRLVSLAGCGEAVQHHHVLRRMRTDGIYFGGAGFDEALGGVKVESDEPLAAIDLQVLKAQAAEPIERAVARLRS